MNSILQHLNQPEYLHVMLNPMPIYGLSMGVVAMIVALISRRRPVIVAALILILLGSLSAWPTYYFGQRAYDGVKAITDAAGGQWLDEHMARGEKLIYAFYLLAAVALAGLLAPMKWAKSSLPLALVTLVLAVGTLGVGGWIAYAGGHIRHPEFRVSPPPPPRADGHSHGAAEGGMDHGAGHGKPGEGQPMDHGAMPEMQPQAPTADQLEASRLQLEASRLQLEVSRKQLEAAEAAKSQPPSPAPQQMASPGPQQTPSPAKDGHDHDH